MAISAQLVKELRERTGAGMMECKKALVAVEGDIEAAIEHMRKTGLAKADKKAGRTAAEGVLAISASDDGKTVTLLEANCETDFVAMGDEFKGFAQKAADLVRENGLKTVEELAAATYSAGETVDEHRKEMIAKIGENMNLRRFETYTTTSGIIGHYVHGSKIGVLVELEGGDDELAKDLAMQIAAAAPLAIDDSGVPAETVAKEKEINQAKFEQSGKPANIIERMIEGALKKYFSEVTLLGQKFIKDPNVSIAQLLKQKNAKVVRYVRYELGEGIEKEAPDFVAEVMAQAKGN